MDELNRAFRSVLQGMENAARAAGRPTPSLLAVSKTRSAQEVRALAAQGQRSFGENYVQEGVGKQQALADLDIQWHLIGHLQTNKCREVAEHFDWVQSLDRARLVTALSRHRPAGRAALNVLIQVNVDGEAGKSGCAPSELPGLAAAVAAAPGLRLRGLMAIPEPFPEPEQRRQSFRALRRLFEALTGDHAGVDTLSMGMSDDYPLAIAEGATLIRIGTALFGRRD